MDLGLDVETVTLLVARCTAAGLDEVIDLANVEPDMVPFILGPAAAPLEPTLINAVAWAEKVSVGWARGERHMLGGGGPRA